MYNIKADMEIIRAMAFSNTTFKVFYYYFLPIIALYAYFVDCNKVFTFCCCFQGFMCIRHGYTILKNDRPEGGVIVSILVYLAYAYFFPPLLAVPLATLTISIPLFFSLYFPYFKSYFFSCLIFITLIALNIHTLLGFNGILKHTVIIIDLCYVISFYRRNIGFEEWIISLIGAGLTYALVSMTDYSQWVMKTNLNDILATFTMCVFIEEVFHMTYSEKMAKDTFAYFMLTLKTFLDRPNKPT